MNFGEIKFKDFFLLSNLFSILRIVLLPVIIFVYMSDIENNVLYAFLLLFFAGITDFLDGFAARKLNQVSSLGLILDPLADKILAIGLLIMLIFARDFPLWFALMIIGRDIGIVIAAALVSRKAKSIPSSDVVGKHYFGSIAGLLLSYMVQFEFGMILFFYSTIVLFIMSSVNYGRMYYLTMKGRTAKSLFAHSFYFYSIKGITYVGLAYAFYRLYIDTLRELLR